MQLPGRFQVFRQESNGDNGTDGNHDGRGCQRVQNPGLSAQEEAGRGIISSQDNRNMITTIELALLFQDVTKIPFKLLYQDCRKDNDLMHLKFMWTGLCRFYKRSYPQIGQSIRRDHSTAIFYFKRHEKMMKEDKEYAELFLVLIDEFLDRLGD